MPEPNIGGMSFIQNPCRARDELGATLCSDEATMSAYYSDPRPAKRVGPSKRALRLRAERERRKAEKANAK